MDTLLFATKALTVLGSASADALAPKIETLALESGTHELNHFGFGKGSTLANRFGIGAITPGHLDDAIDLLFGE